MAKKQETKAVAVCSKAAPPEPVDLTSAMAGDAGRGFENMTPADLAIPFILILQALSPQVKRGEQQIKGANEGDIYNSVTGTVFSGEEGIYFIPAAYRKAWVEWTPREEGGGFIAQHDSADILQQTTKNEKGQDVLPNGHIIVTTAYHYGVVVDPVTGDLTNAVISMTSTQLKKSRKWNSVMSNMKLSRPDGTKFVPPMFGFMYKLTTVQESNEVGSWSGWNIEFVGQVPNIEMYQTAKLFAENVSIGAVKTTPPQQTIDTAPDAY